MGQTQITIVDKLPSENYQPTAHLAVMHIVSGKMRSSVIIQRHDSTVKGEEPVWKPLPTMVAQQQAPLIVLPNIWGRRRTERKQAMSNSNCVKLSPCRYCHKLPKVIQFGKNNPNARVVFCDTHGCKAYNQSVAESSRVLAVMLWNKHQCVLAQPDSKKKETPEPLNLDLATLRTNLGADFLDIKITSDKVSITAGLVKPVTPQMLSESKEFTCIELQSIDDPLAYISGKFEFFRQVAFTLYPRREYA
jgi:hypothetical protein